MKKPAILALAMALLFIGCRDPENTRAPHEIETPSDPAVSSPARTDTLRRIPAKRETRKKQIDRRKKALDTLKPVTI